jgi:Protein of unknown function (DUF3037)
MQEHHLFEYAVVRLVPRVEREEFINVGVILLCVKQKFLSCLLELDEKRLMSLCTTVDIAEVKNHMQSFDRISKGGKAGGPIGMLPVAERFRWVTSNRSTVVQCSPVHPGLCYDPEATLQRLFEQLVKA